MKRVSKKYTNPHIDHHRPIFTSGQPAASVATTLPPRYGSSAEESSPKPSETDEKPKKNEKKRKTTRKKGTDDDHVPLGPGTRDDDDDEGSDDLVGLDNLLQLGEDGGPKKNLLRSPALVVPRSAHLRPSEARRRTIFGCQGLHNVKKCKSVT